MLLMTPRDRLMTAAARMTKAKARLGFFIAEAAPCIPLAALLRHYCVCAVLGLQTVQGRAAGGFRQR